MVYSVFGMVYLVFWAMFLVFQTVRLLFGTLNNGSGLLLTFFLASGKYTTKTEGIGWVYLVFGMVYLLFGTLNKESILPKQRGVGGCHKVGPTFKLMILSKGRPDFHSNFGTSKLTPKHFGMKCTAHHTYMHPNSQNCLVKGIFVFL